MEVFQTIQKEIDWAKSRIEEARERLGSYFSENPFAIVLEDDPETGHPLYKIKRVIDPPGDVEHLFRNALLDAKHSFDRSLIAAAKNFGRKSFDSTYPWADTIVGVKGILRKRQSKQNSALPLDIIREIFRQKPYAGSPEFAKSQYLVRALAALANDKHSLGIVVGPSLGSWSITNITGAHIGRSMMPWDPVKNEMILFEILPGGFIQEPNISISGNVFFYRGGRKMRVNAIDAMRIFIEAAQASLDGFKAISRD